MKFFAASFFQPLLVLGCVGSLALPSLALQSGNLTIVDDDDSTPYPHLGQALAFAQEGDVIILKPGFYGFVELQWVGVSLIAEIPGTAVFGSQIRVTNIGLGSRVVLSGLRNTPKGGELFKGAGLYVSGCDGAVHVENCFFEASGESSGSFYNYAAGDIRYSHDVRLVDCTFQGAETDQWDGEVGSGTTALQALTSTLTISGGSYVAGGGSEATADSPATPGASAIYLNGSTATIEGALCVGGAGGPGNEFPAGPDGQPVVHDGAPGGTALFLDEFNHPWESGFSTAFLRDFHGVVGPSGGVWPGAVSAQPGPPGYPIVVDGENCTATYLPGSARSLSVDNPAVSGTLTSVEVNGAPGDLGLLLVGTSSAPVYLEGQAWPLLMSASELLVLTLGVTDEAGQIQAQFQMPALQPGMDSAHLSLQAIVLPQGSSELKTAPAAELILIGQGL